MSDDHTHPAYPPRPTHEPPPAPPAPDPAPVSGARSRRRARRPVGLSAAVAIVAIVAAAVGGGSAALVSEAANDGSVSSGISVVEGTNASSEADVSDVVEAVGPSVVEIDADSSSGSATGSGVVISEDGEILTNNHVVSGAERIEVTFADGGGARAEIVGTDPDLDMALLRVDGAEGLAPATLGDSDKVRVGDRVVAFGSPEGLSNTVTSGIVSAKDREVTVEREDGNGDGRPRGDGSWPFEFGGDRYNGEIGRDTTTYRAIQTDASLNPGNSGGPLVTLDGTVVGINSAIHSNASSSSEAGSVGLGFAVPINDVKEILDDLRAGDGR
ncbi:S1C family serine protease [Streptomyces macrosporus]|uniref:Trypsin-like peptidase domain-containing protein n=1 Tax=Streptomyces macrosporus TaxID=44032 RepID=A0ABN3JEK6_9ACTN